MTIPTLSEFFESTFMLLRIKQHKLKPATESSYRESLSHWKNITSDPGMDQITDLTVAKFVTELAERNGKKGPKMANSSIQKHCRQVDTVLQMAGPRSRHNRRGQGLIAEPPYLESPKVEKNPPQSAWSIDELRSMYKAADVMVKPQFDGISAPDWWRSFVVLAYYLGLRVTALLHVTKPMLDGSWLTVSSDVSKGGKGSRHYVHREALEHIKAIRSETREIILPFHNWSKGRRMAYVYLRKLQDAAGIVDKARRFGFHGFRKAHSSMIASLSIEHQSGLRTAQRSAGHSDLSITLNHYVSLDVQERLLVDAIDRMPSPCVPVVTFQPVEKVQRLEFVREVFRSEREFID